MSAVFLLSAAILNFVKIFWKASTPGYPRSLVDQFDMLFAKFGESITICRVYLCGKAPEKTLHTLKSQ